MKKIGMIIVLILGIVLGVVTNLGSYIDSQKYNNVNFINTNGSLGNSNLIASVGIPEVPLQIMAHNDNTKPPVATVLSSITPLGSILAVKDSKLYESSGETIKRSDNWGLDGFATTIGTVTGATSVYKLLLLDNGNAMAWGTSGKVFVSTDGLSTWKVVLDMGASPTHELFGAKAYGQYVMFGQYSNVLDAATKYYISEDSGVTVREIFNIYSQAGYAATGIKKHCHSCAIDPYETTPDGKPMLWICIGDGIGNQMYFWSKDFGVTWNAVAAKGYEPIQATEIIPLRNCVLFVSDARSVSVVRYNRPLNGTHVGQYLAFETASLLFEGWGKAANTEVPIGSTPAIDFVNSKAYFGWGMAGNSLTGNTTDDTLLKGQVYATDGYKIYEIYKNPTPVRGQGVYAVYGPDSSGNVVARIDGLGAIRLSTGMWN